MVADMDTAPHPSGAQWTISHGDQEAIVVEVGGGLRTWRAGDRARLDGYEPDEICVGAAGQILAPWPNRIRDGQYEFRGETHQVALTEPATHTALHGLVRWLPWRLVDASESALTCECTLFAQPGYPWSLRLRNTWSLTDEGLTGEHKVTNLSAEPAPFGFSVHPYVEVPGVSVDQLRLQMPTDTRLLTDARLLPVAAVSVKGTEFDFTTARRIGELNLDTAFTGVSPEADGGSAVTVTGPDGAGVRIWADASFGWWQVFTGDTLPGERRRRSVAVEPMTCPPDAFRSGRDVLVLEPAQSWRATWRLSPIER